MRSSLATGNSVHLQVWIPERACGSPCGLCSRGLPWVTQPVNGRAQPGAQARTPHPAGSLHARVSGQPRGPWQCLCTLGCSVRSPLFNIPEGKNIFQGGLLFPLQAIFQRLALRVSVPACLSEACTYRAQLGQGPLSSVLLGYHPWLPTWRGSTLRAQGEAHFWEEGESMGPLGGSGQRRRAGSPHRPRT